MKIIPSTLPALQAAGAVPQLLRGKVTFVAGTTGAVAQHTVFTITGMVAFGFFAQCITALTSGGAATISHGNAGSVAALGAATTATTIDEIDGLAPGSTTWMESATFGTLGTGGLLLHVSTGTDITADILTTTITGGVLEYILFWVPLSAGATITLGSELVAS